MNVEDRWIGYGMERSICVSAVSLLYTLNVYSTYKNVLALLYMCIITPVCFYYSRPRPGRAVQVEFRNSSCFFFWFCRSAPKCGCVRVYVRLSAGCCLLVPLYFPPSSHFDFDYDATTAPRLCTRRARWRFIFWRFVLFFFVLCSVLRRLLSGRNKNILCNGTGSI